MNIQRCFDILDLKPGAGPEEARQAYKDAVNVWHPDRFSSNPRLKKKAEMKVKEINAAYDEIKAFIASNDHASSEQGRRPAGSTNDDARDTVEIVAEAGTRIVLGVWSYLSKTLSRINESPDRGDKGRGPRTGPKKE